MASVDVKGAFPNTPQRLIEEVWRQFGLPYGDFVGKYLCSRTYTVATGKGCTERVTPGSGVPQSGVVGPFLYMLAMLPLMIWMASEYPQLARAPHTSAPQAYVDDAVPMAWDEKAQQVVQDLMQRYGRDNHLVWSAEKSAVLRRGGEVGMALDVGDGVAWLERAEEAVVLGHVQAMEAGGVKLPENLLRGFRAMLVVLLNHPPVGTDDPVLPTSSAQCSDRVPGDAPPVLEGAVRGGRRGSAEAHLEVLGDTHGGTLVCVAVAEGLLLGGGGGGGAGGGGVQGTYGENTEQDMPQSGGGGATGVLSRGRGGAEGGEHVPTLCVAQAKAVGGGEEGAHVARPIGGVAGGGAHVGDQQDVRQAWTGPGAGRGPRGGGTWNRTVG